MVSYIQSASKNSGASNSSTLAYGSNVTAGNFKVAAVSKLVNGSTLGCSDNLDGTWAQAIVDSAPNDTVGIFYKFNATGGATTITFTGTGASGELDADILEFSGIVLASALDQTGQNDHNSFSATLLLSTSAPTTQAIELVIATSIMHVAKTSTWDSGYTQDPNGLSTASVVGSQGVAYFITSATGTQSSTITASANTTMAGVIATFFTPSAGPPVHLMGQNCYASSDPGWRAPERTISLPSLPRRWRRSAGGILTKAT